MLDLLPVPTAIISLSDGTVRFEAVNLSFRAAGFSAPQGRDALLDGLADQITGFLRSVDCRRRMALRIGDAVDSRHYDVTLARRPESVQTPRCVMSLVDQTPEQRTETSLRREMSTDLADRPSQSDRLCRLGRGRDRGGRPGALCGAGGQSRPVQPRQRVHGVAVGR
ncbi:hypothetical protein [Sphingomonas hankookensis]|uniref:hypothetical protein n=1 Tax=Sphingomonas hankookensis TaxID=563996 RepID=UPI003F7AFDCE